MAAVTEASAHPSLCRRLGQALLQTTMLFVTYCLDLIWQVLDIPYDQDVIEMLSVFHSSTSSDVKLVKQWRETLFLVYSGKRKHQFWISCVMKRLTHHPPLTKVWHPLYLSATTQVSQFSHCVETEYKSCKE